MPLPQIRIVSISPYPEMERIVQDVIAAHPQRGRIDNRIITATVDRLDLSELHDCYAIIARGYSARRLKAQGLGVPVIDIAISGYDVIRSIQECQRRFQTRRIGFVGFYNAFNGIEQFSGMFGCDIRVYIPECAAEIRHALELAKQDGCDVIVGGYSVQQDAGLLGLPAILLRTGRETYAQSLEEAIRTVTLVQQERIRTETYKIITESVKDGLLYVDASGIIRLDNPAACLMRDAPLKDVPLETAFPCMKDSFSRAMRDCAEIQGEVRKVRGVSITFDCTPVAVNGIAAGVVISFQNVDKVQQLEEHIRKKLSNKGLTAKHHLSDIVHCSRLIDETIEDACRYAAASSNILIVGETGTGKELFAQGIHNASQRRNGPFVAINCAALPENLLESELFGYVEGAFTGTTRGGKMGLFELAHNGTLFLDEISEIPLNMQSKLLRVLQEHEVRRIGDDRVTAVDVRIISATNVNLHKLVAAKRFRQDLLYRLDVLKITIPPLRRRGEDVIELFHFFLKKFCWKNREALPEVAPDSLHLLREYPFAGNARELRNVVERAAVLRRNRDVLTSADLNRALHPEDIEEVPPLLAATPAPFPPEAPQASGPDNEKDRLLAALRACGGNRTRAARELGMDRTTLWRKLQKYIQK
ncbi:sigma 54-interacting transcriptional regulator [Bilophila wadsworthia]|uniref:sigma 54-interacting transcriptional regulator n=1 Tax=Bilophila wadsworthia TaxID=35833 RepID=UPI0024310C24|nr:sigma 54-interacting transcriptional regulator [Bilophila wadsworthia]